MDAIVQADLELLLIKLREETDTTVHIQKIETTNQHWIVDLLIGEEFTNGGTRALWILRRKIITLKPTRVHQAIAFDVYDQPNLDQAMFWQAVYEHLLLIFYEANPEYRELREYQKRAG